MIIVQIAGFDHVSDGLRLCNHKIRPDLHKPNPCLARRFSLFFMESNLMQSLFKRLNALHEGV